jgi:shikimate kinase
LNNIILCGFKSSGKTTLGKKISEKTGLHFIDTDELVSKEVVAKLPALEKSMILSQFVGAAMRPGPHGQAHTQESRAWRWGDKMAQKGDFAGARSFATASKNCRALYLHSAEAFREIEKEVIAALADFQNCVIATGGGSILEPENVLILKKLGKIFFLRVPKEELKKRILVNPLPAFINPEDPEGSFEQMYQDRIGIYEAVADHIVDSED